MFALTRFENRKLLSQRRSLVAFGGVALINILFAIAFILRSNKAGEPMRGVEGRLVGEFLNAYVYTQTILSPCMYMLFPSILAIVGCHILATECELGSIRLIACRAIERWQILVGKFLALCCYSTIMLLSLLVVSHVVAVLLFDNTGDMIIIGHMYGLKKGITILPEAIAVPRILMSYLFSLPMLFCLGAMALMFSLVTRHFTSASITTITVYYCCHIVNSIPFLEAIHPFLPTRYMSFWRLTLYADIPWDRIGIHAFWTFGYTGIFLGIAIALFNLQEL